MTPSCSQLCPCRRGGHRPSSVVRRKAERDCGTMRYKSDARHGTRAGRGKIVNAYRAHSQLSSAARRLSSCWPVRIVSPAPCGHASLRSGAGLQTAQPGSMSGLERGLTSRHWSRAGCLPTTARGRRPNKSKFMSVLLKEVFIFI